MWISELRAVTFGSSSVLRLSGPDALRRAALSALQEAVPEMSRPELDRGWTSYEASRVEKRWTDQRELPLGVFLRDALGPDASGLAPLETAIAERFGASLEWYPDVLPALDYLRESGYRTALLLDLPLRLPPSWLERAGRWFDGIIHSMELGVRTPGAGSFTEAIRRLHAVPARVLHLGDGLVQDVYGAHRAGLRTALLERPQRSPPDSAAIRWLRSHENLTPDAVRPDLKLRGLEELAAVIDASV